MNKQIWQNSQLELIMKALANDSGGGINNTNQDVLEGKPPVIQRRYDQSLIEMETPSTTEIERTPNFYLKSKHSVRIGSILFRLCYFSKFARWFLCWYRSNNRQASSSSDIKDTFMKASLWDLLQMLPAIEDILGQIGNTKTQDEIIPYLKNDKHLERDDEKFYDPLFTIISPSTNLQVRCYMSQSGYAFAIRQPSYRKFGSKVWLGAKVILYVGEMRKLVKLIKAYASLVEQQELEQPDHQFQIDEAEDFNFSVDDLKEMTV